MSELFDEVDEEVRRDQLNEPADPDVKAWGRETGNEIIQATRTGDEFRFVIRRVR